MVIKRLLGTMPRESKYPMSLVSQDIKGIVLGTRNGK